MRYTVLVVGLICGLASGAVQAQNYHDQGQMKDTNSYTSNIDLTLGLTLGAAPEYKGGDDYEAVVAPVFALEYKDAVFANLTSDKTYDVTFADRPHGIGFNLVKAEKNGFSAGLSVLPEFGRDANDASRLNGTGDIDWTALAGGYAKYTHDAYFAMAQIHQDFLNEHDGFKGELALGGSHLYNRQLRGVAKAFAKFGSDDYNQTYFGISTAQNANSGLPVYNAESGFNEIGIAGNLTYAVTPGTFLRGFAQWSNMIGDASDSPILEDETQFLLGTTVGYRF